MRSLALLLSLAVAIAADPVLTATAEHPRGAMLHAYEKATGKELGRVFMPATGSGTPMTYMLHGRQYIVIAVSGVLMKLLSAVRTVRTSVGVP